MHYRLFFILSVWMLLSWAAGGSVWALNRLDDSFGLGGRVAVELGARNSGHAVLMQPDGRILVAGSSARGQGLAFSLLRFNRDGSLDATFNHEGSVVTSLSPGDNEILALGRLSDGRIIAAGYSHNGRDRDFALACYTPSGALDRSFGDRGVVLLSIGNSNEEITALTVSARDVITLVGSTEGTAGRVLAVMRYFANGEPDQAFGEQGLSLIGVGANASAEGIIERKDGTLVIAGSYRDKNTNAMMLVGLRPDGTLDTAFGHRGVATASAALAASESYRLAEDRETGLLYAAGAKGPEGRREAALFRFTPDGRPDSSFGAQGVLTRQAGDGESVLFDVAVRQGAVVASGYATQASLRQFLVLAGPETTSSAVEGRGSASAGSLFEADRAPLQRLRMNGNTWLRIGQLQVPDARLQVKPLELATSYIEFLEQAKATSSPFSSVAALQTLAGERTSVAATRFHAPVEAPPGQAQTFTTSFGEGESVSYATTLDQAGNIVAVGTAGARNATSIAVARYAVEILEDSIVDQPGHRSSHIATQDPGEVTQTSTVIKGEVAPSFAGTVIQRGVVFSTRSMPLYEGTGSTPSSVSLLFSPLPEEPRPGSWPETTAALLRDGLPRALDGLASFFVAEAQAAPANGNRSKAVAPRFLERGETRNGAGHGAFTVLLEHLRPGTVYHARTYILTSDRQVYYGNQQRFRTADACFVATAALGSLLHPAVGLLRDFRDVFLLETKAGRTFVDWYYSASPALAEEIARSPVLRGLVQAALLPVVGFSWLALRAGLAPALLAAVGLAVFAGWLGHRLRRRATFWLRQQRPASPKEGRNPCSENG